MNYAFEFIEVKALHLRPYLFLMPYFFIYRFAIFNSILNLVSLCCCNLEVIFNYNFETLNLSNFQFFHSIEAVEFYLDNLKD